MQGIVEWEDLDIFFDEDEFGVKATIICKSGGRFDAVGIFDTPYQQRDFGGFIVDADAPSFTCKWTDDLDNVQSGDMLRLYEKDSTDYETFYIESAPQSDGTGTAKLVLTRKETQDHEGDPAEDTHEAPTGGGLFAPNPGRS